MTANFIAVLMVLMFSGGEQTDLVSFLPPRDYFQSRKIETSLEKMIELASQAPADPKNQLQQLLALRVLAEDAKELKASPQYKKYRQTLDEIAQGKTAQDPAGFAQEYAARTLACIDGKKAPLPRAASLEEGLGWFPENPCFVVGMRSQTLKPPATEPRCCAFPPAPPPRG